MKYFVDTEFVYTTGTGGATIYPLSIGVVAEDGREFYRVNEAAIHNTRVTRNLQAFVKEHVIPVLFKDPAIRDGVTVSPLADIANDLRAFIGDDITPQFVGEYAAFDYVVLSTIMGGFDKWPEDWPMHIRDLMQESCPESVSALPHNALADARAVRDAWRWPNE